MLEMPISCDPRFEVLAETDGWIAVNKHAPLLAHPTNTKNEPTLWHGLRQLLCYELETGGQLSIINRLDRETSGITLVAKSSSAARALGKAMQRREFVKRYEALVLGHPDWDEYRCHEPICRQGDLRESRIWVRQCCDLSGKACETHFRVLKRFPSTKALPALSLIECSPHTGRMHQIRVHLSHIGYPILGDKIYGPSEDCYLEHIETGWTPSLQKQLFIPRHALHASYLQFPWAEEMIHIYSSSPDYFL